MGRPKVPQHERRRAAIACSYCRATKKKCSATTPCVHCIKRGIADSCTFAPTTPSSVIQATSVQAPVPNMNSLDTQRGPAKRRGSTDSDLSVSTSGARTLVLQSPRRHMKRPKISNSDSALSIASSASAGSGEAWTRPRLLFNLRGEQVYIGQAASLSFLQLAREIVVEHIGPSEFSHNGKIQTMLETASPSSAEQQTPLPLPDVLLDTEKMLAYARVYTAAVDGLMGLFAPSEIEGLLVGSNAMDARYRNPYKRATVDLIIAIGAQCASPGSASDVGQPYFRHAQQLAVSEMLEDSSVDMIRAFLLMAFYMMGSCRRNAAFMYIGVATRAAVVLGLHSRASYADMSLPRYQLRLRIWISLCVIDMVASAILGRPAATASLRADMDLHLDQMASAMQGTEMDLGVLMSAYKILSIISDIVDNLYARKTVPGAFIEQYLDTIEAWKRDYGGDNTTKNGQPSENNNIGKIHVSCLYYFAVTLVTRPILILTLVAPPPSRLLHPTWSQMAHACVEAAIYLVQACVDGQDGNILLGNMCILKALVFVAGLILGLQSFSKRHIDYKVETAFAGARRNLEFLGRQSPQAAHYSEILRLLLKAITKQREQQALASRNRYVSRLHTTTTPSNTPVDEALLSPRAPSTALTGSPKESSIRESSETRKPTTINAPDGRKLGLDLQICPRGDAPNSVNEEMDSLWPTNTTDEMHFNWDNFDLSQWDDFLGSRGMIDSLDHV